jgi:prepilin-type N-terminal cleavage/methylation domain-containing protein
MIKDLRFKNKKIARNLAFTLVEMLVVIAIIGILSTVLAGGYVNSQKSSRDAARKLQLKSISDALNSYYADYGRYPLSTGTTGITNLIQTQGEFSASGNIYIKKMPKETSGMQEISYKVSATGKSFYLFTNLENIEDKACNPACGSSGTAYVVSEGCCYAITSSNTTLSGVNPSP